MPSSNPIHATLNVMPCHSTPNATIHALNSTAAGGHRANPINAMPTHAMPILLPCLQLAAAVLGELEYPPEEIGSMLDTFRKKHLAELQSIVKGHANASLGYGVVKNNDSPASPPALNPAT